MIVALDHPRTLYSPGLANVPTVIEQVLEGGATGLMLTAPMAARFEEQCGATPLVVSVSIDTYSPDAAVENALRLDASAVKYEVFPDTDQERETFRMLEGLVAKGTQLSLPIMAEVIPGGFSRPECHTASAIAHAGRMAAEAGADLVKLPLPTKGEVATILENIPIPVLFLGGPPNSADEELLGQLSDAAAFGAAGVVMGRRIWERRDPAEAIAEVRRAFLTT